MLYDATGKMNSITGLLVPFCLGLKLFKKFNQSFQNSIFSLCLKAIFFCSLLGNHLTDDLKGKIMYFIFILRAVGSHRSKV